MTLAENSLPERTWTTNAPADEAALEEALSQPTPRLCQDFEALDGDIIVLGAGGKMGPSLARMARRALDTAGRKTQRVLAVARFSDPAARRLLEAAGIEAIPADLSDRAQVAALPDAANVLFMAGQKFGTSDAPENTWMMNTYVPALVAERYAGAKRVVAFSTGCVYSNVTPASGGSREDDPTEPLGDYANSCVGRERIFTYFAKKNGMPTTLFRLNYAVDLRYGVLVDIARKVQSGEPVDVTMGYANVIWQGDANAQALQSLLLAEVPARALNVTGAEILSVRALAEQFGKRFGVTPKIVGEEAPTALLSNPERAYHLLGPPSLPLDTLILWVGTWLMQGNRLLNKPTHYETRDGKY